MEEWIWVVARTELFAGGHLQGFCTSPAVVARFLQVAAAHGRFAPRRPVEEDASLKQIVPYGIVLHHGRVFLFRRGEAGAEAGLRGRWSIGLGGHVNPGDEDESGALMLAQALRREVSEEVALDNPHLEVWGVLNDDLDPVGRRHLGFVYRVEVASPRVRSREPGKVQGRFVPLAQAWARRARMESWSRIVLEALTPPALPTLTC